MPNQKSRSPYGENKFGLKPKLMPTVATIKRVKSLAKLHCTQAEAASVMDVSLKVFKRFISECPEVKEAWWAGKHMGKKTLRRLQWKQAEESVPMSIFLGKQYLEQADKREQTLDVTDHRTAEQLEAGITALIEQIRANGPGDRPEAITLDAEPGETEELQPVSETEDLP